MSFQKRLAANEFVVLAEMHTPKGVNISRLVNDARRMKGKIDGVVIPDMDNGIMRMSSIAGGVLMQQQGIESILHVYCRDRNRMALQGDILAAHVLGIQNLIVAHSEDIENGDHPEAVVVNDLNEVELLKGIAQLQRGKDMEGFELDGVPTFTTGCTIEPFADEAQMVQQLKLAKDKVAAGASFVITPAVFDITHFSGFYSKVRELGVPVIPTVFLIKSLAIAQYIATTEPSSQISNELINRIRKSPNRDQEGVKIAGETIAALREMTQGVLVQTLGWEHKLPEILDAAGM
ncbi:methylenetetrahydrofolate reductase [Desulfosediminicola ganghwensis]|uniref:methylenetetrahydrofolate reductase n=1 Tax=Desulfosediminicola ganghwensis TaxID=2569540 RepID=UPI0010ABAEE6|nr:methylenetetrahydrofolate reductase [Desulfosediminicola ganghwensis]